MSVNIKEIVVVVVEHQVDYNRFVLTKDDNECVLEYCLADTHDGKKIDFTSTYVPFVCRGQGLAEQLVEVGLAWAKEQDYEMEASCWYVKKFL